MKIYSFLFIVAFSLFTACASKKETTTTYYFIRHAEKDRTVDSNRNPDLNEKGLARSKKWEKYFQEIHLDAVYATNYNRTMQTAQPTANSKNLEILNYDPRKMYDSVFQKNTKGKTVLIVGHSNTTPAFVNKIMGDKIYKNMDDNENSSLYIVTIIGEKKESEIKKVK